VMNKKFFFLLGLPILAVTACAIIALVLVNGV